MPTLTVTAKGQITLNKEVLRHLGVAPGDQVTVDKLPGHSISLRAGGARKSIRSVFGILHNPDGPKLTLEEIKTEIEDGWAGKR